MSAVISIRNGRPVAEIADHRGEVHDYEVRPLPVEGAASRYSVARVAGEDAEHAYTVTVEGVLWSCTCPAYVYSKAKPHTCKHVECVKALHRFLQEMAR